MKSFLLFAAFLLLIQVSSIRASTLSCLNNIFPCLVSTITPLTSSDEEILISGKPANFVDPSTTSLTFTGPVTLNFVPSGIFKIFPRLNGITFTNASITSVTSNAFNNCGNLYSISFSNNNFPILSANFASSCINVTSIFLSNNGIKKFDNDALKGLTFLNSFYASFNNISCIPPGFFQHTPVVAYIDLSYNKISELDSRTFKSLANLNNLNLGYNNILNIPAFDLTNTALTFGFMFQINSNPIQSIDPLFITSIFNNRYGMSSTNVQMYVEFNTTTCIPKNSQYSYVSSHNWPVANISFADCYKNWKNEFKTTPISCADDVEQVETTTKGGNVNNGSWPFLGKDFFAIITNSMKNFNVNVSFN